MCYKKGCFDLTFANPKHPSFDNIFLHSYLIHNTDINSIKLLHITLIFLGHLVAEQHLLMQLLTNTCSTECKKL